MLCVQNGQKVWHNLYRYPSRGNQFQKTQKGCREVFLLNILTEKLDFDIPKKLLIRNVLRKAVLVK